MALFSKPYKHVVLAAAWGGSCRCSSILDYLRLILMVAGQAHLGNLNGPISDTIGATVADLPCIDGSLQSLHEAQPRGWAMTRLRVGLALHTTYDWS
jgi:hypothetical protein